MILSHSCQLHICTLYLASCMIYVMSSFMEVTRSCGEVYICSLMTGSGLVATANGGGFTVSTLLQSLFNIRVPAIGSEKQQAELLIDKIIVCFTSFRIQCLVVWYKWLLFLVRCSLYPIRHKFQCVFLKLPHWDQIQPWLDLWYNQLDLIF